MNFEEFFLVMGVVISLSTVLGYLFIRKEADNVFEALLQVFGLMASFFIPFIFIMILITNYLWAW